MADKERLIDKLIARMEAMSLEERARYIRSKLENGPARAAHEARQEQRRAAHGATLTARATRMDDRTDAAWLIECKIDPTTSVVVESDDARGVVVDVDELLHPVAA